MRRLLILVVLSAYASAGTYYVSASGGNDSNNGTSAATPWKTLASVSTGGAHASLIVPGTTVLLARGDVWVESLIPPASGTSGNPITFDAYGSGAAPEITGYKALGTWTQVSGYTNQWSAPLTASGLNYVLFGTIWGTKQSSQGALAHDRDFFLNGGLLYVYAPSNPTTYYGTVAAILPLNSLSSDQAIYINGKQWLVVQHIKLDWFDQFGVNVAGASDHLVFANMESDGMVPAGALPHGFYVNASSPSDLKFINVDAHMNYDGLRFDGTLATAGAATIVNARGYFNRNYGIDDTTGGHATYSYCHLYGNGIAVLGSSDPMEASGAVELGGAGNGHNVPSWTAPLVNNFARYPARITYTIDDEGKSPGGADFIDSVLPQFTSRNLKLSIAVVTGEQYAAGDVPRIQGWLNAGHDINAHSWSHNYYDNPAIFSIRYNGAGTAATMKIVGSTLTTTVTGGPGGENLTFDLTNASYSDYTKLVSAISGRSGYTASLLTGALPHGHSTTLAPIGSGVDIKNAAYSAMIDPTLFVPDEMASSAAWLLGNLTGLPASELVYVYPSGKENYQTQLYAAAAGFKGGRGSLSMGQAIAGTFSTNAGPAPLESNVRSVSGYGVNVQNITSLGAENFSGLSASQIAAQVGALVNKAKAWGVPYGLFTHPPETGAPELTANEIGAVLDGLIAANATVLTNTQLVDYLAAQPQVSGSTMAVAAATGGAMNLWPSSKSASVLQGSNVSATYGVDIQGVKRPATGAWDVGAYQTPWTKVGAPGSGTFKAGGTNTVGLAALPQVYVNNHECDPPGGVYDVEKHIPGDYACTSASTCATALNQAGADWKNAPDQWWHVIVTAGVLASGGATGTQDGTWHLPAKSIAGAQPTKCLVFESSTPLTAGQVACTHGIQDNLPGLTDIGTRDTSCAADVGKMYTVENAVANAGALDANAIDASGVPVNHVVVRDAELRETAGAAQAFASIVTLGPGALTAAQAPAHIGLDRVWIHGDATDTAGGANLIPNALLMNCSYCWLENFFISSLYRNSENHGINWLSSPGPSKVDHGWLDGASIGMFFGGATPSIPNTTAAYDVEIRRVRNTYPYALLGAPNYYHGGHDFRKNSFEIKEAQRVLVDGSIFENVDASGGQHGVIMGLSARSCSAFGSCDNYPAITADITIQNTILRNACNGLEGDTRSGGPSAGIAVGWGQQRVNLYNILEYNIGPTVPGCGASNTNFSVNGYGAETIFWTTSRASNGYEWQGHVVVPTWRGSHAYNLGDHMRPVVASTPRGGDYVAIVSGTSAAGTNTPSLATAIQGTGGTFTDGTVTWRDTDTVCSSTRNSAGTQATITCPGGTGQNQTDIVTGDPIAVTYCADSTFNASAKNPLTIATFSDPTQLSVTYPNAGTPSATTQGCHLSNRPGYGRYETYNHVTMVGDFESEGPASTDYYTALDSWRNWTYKDSIFTGQGPNNLGSGTSGEGTSFFQNFYDVPSLAVHHIVFADRTGSVTWAANTAYAVGDTVNAPAGKLHRYTVTVAGTSGSGPTWCITFNCLVTDGTVTWMETSGSFPGASGYTEYNNGVATTPPVTLWFPKHSYCQGASPDASCVGFSGGLNTTSVLNLRDWRNYALHPSSQYHNQASDGTDVGADIPAIINAMKLTQCAGGYPN